MCVQAGSYKLLLFIARLTHNPMALKNIRLFITIFGATGLLVLATVFLAPVAYTIWRIQASEAWPSTSGTILESGTYQTARRKVKVHPFIRYVYAVDEATYVGSTIQSMEYAGPEQALDIARRFPLGPVQVYYDPLSPGDSQFLPGGSTRILWAMLIGGSAMFGVGLFMILLIRRSLKSAD